MSDMSSRKVEDRLTAGLDLGDLYTHMCVLDESGEVVEEARIASTPKAFRQRFRTMPPARLVLEAGTHSPWASRLLESVGHEVIVANPRMLRFIYGNDSKNDRADAAYLARVGKLDPGLLHPLIHRSEEGSAHRALLRSREALVGGRARLIIHTRSLVKPFGARLPRCSTDAFATKVLYHVPEILLPALEPVISVISALNVQHLESLNDVLQKTLGITVRETVPDWVISLADQVINLDISAEDLRQRLMEGKVYSADKVATALSSFFTEENLTTLRELALREVASTVDRAREGIVDPVA